MPEKSMLSRRVTRRDNIDFSGIEPGGEVRHRRAGPLGQQQGLAARLAAAVGAGPGTLGDLAEAVMQGRHQHAPAAGIVDEIILDEGIAPHHPDVPQHLEEHARRATRDPLPAQAVEQFPHVLAQQANDDLPVGKGRVVVRDFADAGGHG